MNALLKLWVNEYDIYQSNSDELMYLQIIQILYDSKQSHNMMSEKLCYWLKQIVEMTELMCLQAMTIIQNNVFHDTLIEFIFIFYDQKHFQWFFMKKITNSKFNIICLFFFHIFSFSFLHLIIIFILTHVRSEWMK